MLADAHDTLPLAYQDEPSRDGKRTPEKECMPAFVTLTLHTLSFSLLLHGGFKDAQPTYSIVPLSRNHPLAAQVGWGAQ